MSKKKEKSSAIIINKDKKSWFDKCLDRIEKGKAPFKKSK